MKAMPITTSYGMGSATSGGMVVMSDSPLFAMRRRDLYRLADAWEIEYSKDAPATEMRTLLMSHGIDGKTRPPNEIQDKPKEDMLPKDWPTFRQFCRDNGVYVSRKDSRETLIEKLKENGKIPA